MQKRYIKLDGSHRKLESWPFVFSILVTMSVLVGGLLEFLPLVLIPGNIPTIESVQPYTPLELEGRDIYIREGCNNCHSQQIRPLQHEIERYGEYSKPGEHVYEHPHLWGSKRTGPDLARIGGKYPDLWHLRHMEDPRSISPNSIMPPYDWLLRKDIKFDKINRKVKVHSQLGVPYSEHEIASADSLARIQAVEIAERLVEQGGESGLEDKEIVAMIAYLQRLGKDLHAVVEESQESHD